MGWRLTDCIWNRHKIEHDEKGTAMRTVGRYVIAVLLLLTTAVAVHGDGYFLSKGDFMVSAPDQKAAIVWDGEVETMIVSTKLLSGDVSDFGWIIPIKSSSQPQVALASIDIFYDLADYFPIDRRLPSTGKYAGGGGSRNVAVIKELQLQAYDVTILTAEEGEALASWLNKHGFDLPDNADSVLSYYTTGEFYLVAVRIAQDRLGSEAESQLRRGLYSPLKISFEPAEPFYPMRISCLNPGHVDAVVYVMSAEPLHDRIGVLGGAEWRPIEGPFRRWIAEEIPVDVAQCITRLVFHGSSASFTKDSVFVPMTASVQESRRCEQPPDANQFEPTTILQTKLRRGTPREIRKALRLGASLDSNGMSIPAIHLPIQSESGQTVEKMQILIEAGADVNSRYVEGMTPLHRVVGLEDGQTIMELLLDAGADINRKDYNGMTALDLAVRSANTGQIKYLLSRGGEVTREGMAMTGKAVHLNPLKALFQAVERKDFDTVKLIVDGGADINQPYTTKAGHGRYVWMAAVESQSVEIVEYLLSHGGVVHGLSLLKDATTVQSPIEVAAANGDLSMVRLLIERGAPADGPALRQACKCGNAEIAVYLLSHGAVPDTETLILAVKSGCIRGVEALLNAGVVPSEAMVDIAENAEYREIWQMLITHPVLSDDQRMVRLITVEQADRITLGMNFEQVVEITGKPQDSVPGLRALADHKFLGYEICSWRENERPTERIVLVFRFNRLVLIGDMSTVATYIHRHQ